MHDEGLQELEFNYSASQSQQNQLGPNSGLILYEGKRKLHSFYP